MIVCPSMTLHIMSLPRYVHGYMDKTISIRALVDALCRDGASESHVIHVKNVSKLSKSVWLGLENSPARATGLIYI